MGEGESDLELEGDVDAVGVVRPATQVAQRHDLVERVGDFSVKPGPVSRQLCREIAFAHALQREEELPELGRMLAFRT